MDDLNGLLGMSNDELTEQAQLIERGVRPLTLLKVFLLDDPNLILRLSTRLENVSVGTRSIPFVFEHVNGINCGFGRKQVGGRNTKVVI